jgi:hypothetical protein
MKSLAFLFLIMAVVFITVGYMEFKFQNQLKQKVIEYRFIPRSLYDEQTQPINLKKSFEDMFEKSEPSTNQYNLI